MEGGGGEVEEEVSLTLRSCFGLRLGRGGEERGGEGRGGKGGGGRGGDGRGGEGGRG